MGLKKKLETYGTLTKDVTFLTSESWKKRRERMGLKKIQVNKYIMD